MAILNPIDEYQANIWHTGDLITADKMNAVENELVTHSTAINEVTDKLIQLLNPITATVLTTPPEYIRGEAMTKTADFLVKYSTRPVASTNLHLPNETETWYTPTFTSHSPTTDLITNTVYHLPQWYPTPLAVNSQKYQLKVKDIWGYIAEINYTIPVKYKVFYWAGNAMFTPNGLDSAFSSFDFSYVIDGEPYTVQIPLNINIVAYQYVYLAVPSINLPTAIKSSRNINIITNGTELITADYINPDTNYEEEYTIYTLNPNHITDDQKLTITFN